jgi:rubrerythrin
MEKYYTAEEILQFAVKMEEIGETLYRKFAEGSKDPRLKRVFNFLADQEIDHKDNFTRILKKFKAGKDPVFAEQKIQLKENVFLNTDIFSPSSPIVLAQEAGSPLDLLKYALEFERQGIYLFAELGKCVGKSGRNIISEIMKEEREHIAKLKEVEKVVRERLV